MIPLSLIPYLVAGGLFVASVLGAYGYGHAKASEQCRLEQVERMARAQVDFERRADRVQARADSLSAKVEAERVRAATLRGRLEEARRNETLITSDPCPRLAPGFFGMFVDLDSTSGAETAGGGDAGMQDP